MCGLEAMTARPLQAPRPSGRSLVQLLRACLAREQLQEMGIRSRRCRCFNVPGFIAGSAASSPR